MSVLQDHESHREKLEKQTHTPARGAAKASQPWFLVAKGEKAGSITKYT